MQAHIFFFFFETFLKRGVFLLFNNNEKIVLNA